MKFDDVILFNLEDRIKLLVPNSVQDAIADSYYSDILEEFEEDICDYYKTEAYYYLEDDLSDNISDSDLYIAVDEFIYNDLTSNCLVLDFDELQEEFSSASKLGISGFSDKNLDFWYSFFGKYNCSLLAMNDTYVVIVTNV